MARRVRATNYTHKINFYKPSYTYNEVTGITEATWEYVFSRWCSDKIIFREQLEEVVSGGNTLRDRHEFTTRFTDTITTTMRCEYKGNLYDITIVGDKRGDRLETAFLAEAVLDGGF